MTLNIKNEGVARLLEEVVALTGESKTEAIRRALDERRDRLTRDPAHARPGERLRRVLEREIWPSIPAKQLGRPLTKADEEAILGYSATGT